MGMGLGLGLGDQDILGHLLAILDIPVYRLDWHIKEETNENSTKTTIVIPIENS